MSGPTTRPPRTALTIAGSDSSGGAGIQADLKTFAALGVYGACAITAVTAQSTAGVIEAAVLSADLVIAQIEAVAGLDGLFGTLRRNSHQTMQVNQMSHPIADTPTPVKNDSGR